jgi:hypothetical protein
MEVSKMTERYLEDYAAGQTFGSPGRLQVDKERILALPPISIHSPSISMKRPLAAACFADWPRAVGTPRR